MSALFNKDIVVLDVTSRLISAIAGCRKAQSVYDVKACAEREYDGYSDGEFSTRTPRRKRRKKCCPKR